jgi:hypothetical protein
MFPSMQIQLTPDRFKPYYRYENVSNAQIQLILKIIPIEKKEKVIFSVLNQAINMIISAKNRSGENFKLDIDTRIKLAIMYTNFRQRFPDLYGNINRQMSIFQPLFLIFHTYLSDKGNDVY